MMAAPGHLKVISVIKNGTSDFGRFKNQLSNDSILENFLLILKLPIFQTDRDTD